MVRPGPVGKAVKHGHGANADWIEVPNVPFAGPWPELPKLANRRKWNELVVQWWAQVRAMPHCILWEPTDWQYAIETALMKDQFWREFADGEMKSTAATELRRREAQLGTTTDARRQLRIRYTKVGAEDESGAEVELPVDVVEQPQAAGNGMASVTPLPDRRSRLTQQRTG